MKVLVLSFFFFSLTAQACKTAAAVVLVEKAKEFVTVEAELVELSVFPGSTFEHDESVELKAIPRSANDSLEINKTPSQKIPPVPGGLALYAVQRKKMDAYETQIKVIHPQGKTVAINLALTPRSKKRGGCGSSTVKYD